MAQNQKMGESGSANVSQAMEQNGTARKQETSIRVNISLLDSLMTLAGELVLSRNQLLQTISESSAGGIEAVGQRIDLITSELQEAIMLTRMQPIGNVFSKFPRVVRDLSKQLGKNIELTIHGKDVELDKTIIEAINDPLTHLIRNGIDHGIELPAIRQKRGKPEVGVMVLSAFHEAGQVVIQIKDDGNGIDGEKLASQAVSKGLISVEQANAMGDKEKVNLIFLPGFSTAEKVTDVSGRGVGMDVVKSNLDKLGGQIDIESEQGVGTTLSIKLPLTLAIIPCQIIFIEGERYAIPQVNLEELLRIPAHQVKDRIEVVGNAEVVRLRGRLLPIVSLADVLGIPKTYIDPVDGVSKADRRGRIADRRGKHSAISNASIEQETIDQKTQSPRTVADRRISASSALNIVVVSSGQLTYGLVVDQLQDSEEIVIKPLDRHLQNCRGYAGATIMGDGRIALILDINDLASMADLTSVDGSDRAAEISSSFDATHQAILDGQAMLIFSSSTEERFAIPLEKVDRIEKIKQSNVEILGDRRVMQYRNGSLPLICIDDVAAVTPLADQDDLLVLVFPIGIHTLGLLATGPIDTREISEPIDQDTLRQTGILGSTIIGNDTTMIVDIEEMAQQLFPEWF